MFKFLEARKEGNKTILSVPRCLYEDFRNEIMLLIHGSLLIVNDHKDFQKQVEKLESFLSGSDLHISRDTLSVYLAYSNCTEIYLTTHGVKRGCKMNEKATAEAMKDVFRASDILEVLEHFSESFDQSLLPGSEGQRKCNESTRLCKEPAEQSEKRKSLLEFLRRDLDEAMKALIQTGQYAYIWQENLIELFRPTLNIIDKDVPPASQIEVKIV